MKYASTASLLLVIVLVSGCGGSNNSDNEIIFSLVWDNYTAMANGKYNKGYLKYTSAVVVEKGQVDGHPAHVILFNDVIYVFYYDNGTGMVVQNMNLAWRGKKYYSDLEKLMADVGFQKT